MAIREGRWDCDSCGTKGNLGRDEHCPHCGAPRSKNVQFYLPEGEPPVSQPDLLRDANAGPDWVCSHCASHNRGYRVTCVDCGAPKGDSPSNPVIDYRLKDVPRGDTTKVSTWECEKCGTRNNEDTSTCGSCGQNRYGETPDKPPQPARPTRNMPDYATNYLSTESPNTSAVKRLAIWASATLAVLAVIFGIWFIFFRTTTTPLVVTGFKWERTISFEQYKTVQEEGWSIPPGGRIVSSYQAIHHYNHILDHYETKTRIVTEQVPSGVESYVCGERSLGNGYFEDIECTRTTYTTQSRTETYQEPVYRDDPVYQTKYIYDIERWVFSRTEKAGNNDHSPNWPSDQKAGNERESRRTENYTVVLSDLGKNPRLYSVTKPLQEWMAVSLGQKFVGEINAAGMLLKLDPTNN